MSRVLVVDDEPRMRELVRIYLDNAGFRVTGVSDGQSALEAIERDSFQLVILDLMMPGTDGWATCSKIRRSAPDMPIVLLTARTSVEDKVTGFANGADDYVTKPFDGRELVARVHALLRRTSSQANTKIYYDGLDLTIDPERRTVRAADSLVSFTPKEFDVLHLFARRPGKTFSREQTLERVWGYEYEGDARTVDSHVKNIREKLKTAGLVIDPIKTVWGIGYRFEVSGH